MSIGIFGVELLCKFTEHGNIHDPCAVAVVNVELLRTCTSSSLIRVSSEGRSWR